MIRGASVAIFSVAAAFASAAEVSPDHFPSTEKMVMLGASCDFADDGGTVFQSNWQTKHWVKINGKTTEFTGEVKMSDAGWYQEFEAGDLHVTLRLRRTGDHGDGVPMVGEIVVTWRGKSKTFTVTGGCGA